MASFAPPALLSSPLEPPGAIDLGRIESKLDALAEAAPSSNLAEQVRKLREAALGLQREMESAAAAEALLTRGLGRLLSAQFEAIGGVREGMLLAAAGALGAGRPALYGTLELVLLAEPGETREEQRIREELGDALERAGVAHRLWSGTSDSLVSEVAENAHARRVLLSTRWISGAEERLARLRQKLRTRVVERFADGWAAAATQSLRERREQRGGSPYLLEPQLEAGAGGLEDLELALWIATVRLGQDTLEPLAALGALDPVQLAELQWARDLLARARNELQDLTGGRETRLDYGAQPEIAVRLGFGGRKLTAIQQMVRRLHLAAAILARGSDHLIAFIGNRVRRVPPASRRIDHAFSVVGDALVLEDPAQLDRAPELMVRAFAVADREGVPIEEATREAITARLGLVDDRLRSHPQVLATIRQMFLRPKTRGAFLDAMHTAGLLGALFPELGRITGLYRQNALHAYAVDVHCLMAARRLYALRNGELLEREPELTRLAQQLTRPLPLFLAVLFHDVGRIREAGHAERGAKAMRQIALRLGLAERDVRDAEFLVRHHLLMSHVSQRRDLSDPQAIEQFATVCGDGERLLMLYLLTWADHAALVPGAWNDWRARLARELYEKSEAFLAGRYGGSPDHLRILRERMQAELLEQFAESEVEDFLGRMPERYVRTAAPEDAVRHFRVLRRARKSELAAWLRHRHSYTELTLCARSRPAALAIFTAVLSAHRIDILRAQLFTTSDDRMVAVFVVEAAGTRVDRARWKAARADLVAALGGAFDADALLRDRSRGSVSPPFSPPLKTRVEIDASSASEATIVDLVAEDRQGLLHDISRALYELGVTVTVAKISTEAGRATDSFYVQKDGRRIDDPELLAQVEEAVRLALEGPD